MIDIVNELGEYGIKPLIADLAADGEEVNREYGITLNNFDEINHVDALVIAVSHKEYEQMKLADFGRLFKNVPNNKKIIIDIKGILNKREVCAKGYSYWRL